MNHQSSDFLARKLRQNWLTHYHEFRGLDDMEDDDSLTNLGWLQNINVTKMAAPLAPLSPPMPTSWPPTNVGARESTPKPPDRCLRNTLELYKQHCINYGVNPRQSPPSKQQSRQSYLFNNYHQGYPRYTPRQPSSCWKAKNQRHFIKRRGSLFNRFKVQMSIRNAGSAYHVINGIPSNAIYPGTNCYRLNDCQTLLAVTTSQKTAVGEVAFLKDSGRVCGEAGLFDDLSLKCAPPTIETVNPEDRLVFQTNQGIRPPYSYAVLIYMSMEATKKNKITLNEIYSWVAENFAFYRKSEPTWKLALRQTLMRSAIFQRVPRRKEEPGGWGDLWRLNPDIRTKLKELSGQSGPLVTSEPTVCRSTTSGPLEPSSPKVVVQSAQRTHGDDQPNASLDHWGGKRCSVSSSSPSSVELHTPPQSQPSYPPKSPPFLSLGLLNLTQEDVSLLQNSVVGRQSPIESIGDSGSSEVKAAAPDFSSLLSSSLLLRECKHESGSPCRSDGDDDAPEETPIDRSRREDWWPDEFTGTVDSLMGDFDRPISGNQKAAHSSFVYQPGTLLDTPLDYSVETSSILHEEQPWVDDKLNLEELDNILGLK
uniref:Fork-head domain-containing protein n=1 Tax=Mesocestoides corti TaxID=53468 RepID=A0A5K3FR20_MESCO